MISFTRLTRPASAFLPGCTAGSLGLGNAFGHLRQQWDETQGHLDDHHQVVHRKADPFQG